MTEPGSALQAVVARWLRVRANVRALAARLAATEHGLQRDARRSDDPQMAILVTQIAAERCALDALGAELDARIAHVRRDVAAQELGFAQMLIAAARAERAGGQGSS